jgi:hypothetical protein
MKFSKFAVLLAGLVGIAAFFLPLIAVKNSGVEGALSAFQIVTGVDSAKEIVDNALAESAQAYVDKANIAEASSAAKSALNEVKGVTLALFAPAVLLAILGIVGLIRQQFGRLAGTGSVLLGLLGLAVWAVLNQAANDAAVDITAGESVKGIGMHLLLGTGALGFLGGLLALIKPDRKETQSAIG